MKAVLITTTVAALVAVAACSRGEEATSTGNAVAPAPTGNAGAAQGNQQIAVLKPEEAYGVRHERFEEIGDQMKAINRELKGSAPDVAAVQRAAARIAELAPQVAGWFPAGSGPDSNPKTRAKAEIFSDEAGMRAAAQQFVEASRAFDAAARAGDVAAIQAAMPALGNSCKNCHDRFRGPER
jgi:cytochrome c556